MDDNHQDIKPISQELPKTIAFSCWKHHLGFARNALNNRTNYSKIDNFIREIVPLIGESNIDYYIGTLDILTIANEVIAQLKAENAFNPTEYKEWLISENTDYRCISLSDGSNWTLRFGQTDERYIHIHPSRHSKETVRVKSSSLKTVYAFLSHYGLSDAEISNEKINFVRNKFAKLPALKPSSPLTAIRRVLDLFLL
ncbi:MAG: hypothetical protein EHM93_05925 [Bacteroidales bacterium]|nr:MAG: hypothetical protein EHM93_05925 [Bacteroidales bacterium]